VYDLEAKQQSSQWKSPSSPHLKKAKQVHPNVKSMLCLLILIGLFIKDLSHRIKMSTSTSTKVSYSIYRRLSGSNIQESGAGDWVLHHDNAPGHTTLSVLTISGQEQHGPNPPPLVLSTSGSWRFIFVAKTFDDIFEIQKISRGTTRNYETEVPEAIPAMAKLLDKVHYITRGPL
jgi:hypothetical protein